jgi:acid phosphatase family membrane protein YuiD
MSVYKTWCILSNVGYNTTMFFPPFLIPIVVGVVTQFLKIFFKSNRVTDPDHTRFDLLPQYGGMPSAHTAFATSLATLVSLTEGIYSNSFAIAICLMIFILDDALRLRVFLGRFGVAIRRLVRLLPEDDQKTMPHIEGRIGHRVSEVIVGAFVGIFLTIVLWIFDQRL